MPRDIQNKAVAFVALAIAKTVEGEEGEEETTYRIVDRERSGRL